MCPHGGIDYAELTDRGIAPSSVIDMSVCTNPYMPPDGIIDAITTIDIKRYPDSESTELRNLISAVLNIPSDTLLVGNGTTELIRLITMAYLEDGDTALIVGPTYGEYEVACQLVCANIVKYHAEQKNNYRHIVEKVVDIIIEANPGIVFICNPNNPTGSYYIRREIENILRALKNGLLVLDEAYVSFVDNSWSSADLIKDGNVIVLRSMTKDCGLAGLRVGYAVADHRVIRTLRKICPPWNVNIAGQKAAVSLLREKRDIAESKKLLLEAKDYLVKELIALGYEVVPSQTHFFLVKVGDAAAFRSALLAQGILVRDCASFGLKEYIRLSASTIAQSHIFIDTVRELKKEGAI